MNFSNVNHILLPEGNAVRITRGGVTLWENSDLPDAYQRVDYIASDGNQYIDTGVMAGDHPAGIDYTLDFRITEWSGTGSYLHLFGAYTDASRSGSLAVNANAGNFRSYCGTGTIATYQWVNLLDKDCTLKMFASSADLESFSISLLMDGEEQLTLFSNYPSGNVPMPELPIHLFRCNGLDQGGPAMRCCAFRMKAANGALLRNFIPCRRKSDDTAGLYDTVTRKFYENAGTGSFQPGKDMEQ